MIRRVLVTSVIFVVTMSPRTYARPPIRKAFFNVYPSAVGSRLDDLPSNSGHCGVCHFDFNGGGPRNPYGLAVQVAIASGMYASTEAAIQSVQTNDSDVDGFSNLLEITDTVNFGNTPTFPGLTSGNVGGVTNVSLSDLTGYLTPSGGTDTTPPTVTVLSPNGGENVTSNVLSSVTWTATDASGILDVAIYLSDDNGLHFRPVALGEANDGTYSWFVPNRPGNQNIVRVVARDNAGNLGSDWSDAPFTIAGVSGGIVPTTLRDLDLPGSQPLTGTVVDDPDVTCVTCHGNYNSSVEPWYLWKGSMMAQAMRDPLFRACLAVAEQDAPSVGDLCLRCHTPGGWLEGHSVDTGGGLVTSKDRQGVQCDFCHRLVDPVHQAGISPAEDAAVLDSVGTLPAAYANGQFVTDGAPIRRGPYADAQASHSFLESPFHRSGNLCGTCHDVSNPAFVAGASPGDYDPQAFDSPHPDGNLRNMFPIERTFSEWSMSDYATSGVYAPQFAGTKADGIVGKCQDCHMRDASGRGCNVSGAPTRSDLPLHDLTGGNHFIPDILPSFFSGEVDAARLQAGKQRAIAMLQKAATMTLAAGQNNLNPTLHVTVTNETGHKLISGYPEGRRMWLHVRAYDASDVLVYESGAYNPLTGELTHDADLKLYHTEPGISTSLASLLGRSPGPSFHFVINDSIYFDNRIPPRGFTNANFEAIQSPPIGYAYADGQYWDETNYVLPKDAVFAEVELDYQTTSKEYVEFLRDENATNTAGQDLYDAWVAQGRCAPVVMVSDTASLHVDPTAVGETPSYRTALLQNAPNPFRAETSIRYEMSKREHALLEVFDVSGRRVRVLVDEPRPAGVQTVSWDGKNQNGVAVASGIYFYRLKTPSALIVRKAIILK
jgi:hypothetical protein